MEEKRTPLEIAGGILENIFSIAEKFITGLTSFGKRTSASSLKALPKLLSKFPLRKEVCQKMKQKHS